MTLFKKSKREKHKLIGASLPLWVDQFLVKYSIAMELTKTDILRELIQNFIKDEKDKYTNIDLLDKIGFNFQKDWTSRKTTSCNIDIASYKREVERQLSNKEFLPKEITIILNHIK